MVVTVCVLDLSDTCLKGGALADRGIEGRRFYIAAGGTVMVEVVPWKVMKAEQKPV